MLKFVPSKNTGIFVLWIVGVIVVTIACSVGFAYLGWPLIFPLLLFAGAATAYRFHPDQRIGIGFFFAGLIIFVALIAHGVHASRMKAADDAAKALIASGKPKPPAGTPASPPATSQQLADMQVALNKANAAIAALQAQKGNGGKTGENGGTGTTPAPPADDLSGILPDGVAPGEEGSLLIKAKNCWYSDLNKMTCRFFVVNKDRQPHAMDVMDSEGTTHNAEESRNFITWRFGGAIRYNGGENRVTLNHGVRNDILATFDEPDGGVNKVSFTLNLSGMDAVAHKAPFSSIPVITKRWN